MIIDFPETGWECATCLAPASVKQSDWKSGFNTFKVLRVEKTCDCLDDKLMNRKAGQFLSPAEW